MRFLSITPAPIAGAGELPRMTNRKCPKGRGKKERKKEKKKEVTSCSMRYTKQKLFVRTQQFTVQLPGIPTHAPYHNKKKKGKKEKIKKNPNQNICRAMPSQDFLRHRNTVREYTSLAGSSLFRGVEIGMSLEGAGERGARTQQAGICDVPLLCSM